MQKQELNQESHADYLPPQATDEINRGAHRAARGEQVVCQQDPMAGKQGVLVDLKGIGAVLQGIRGALRLIWQLPGLSDQGRPRMKLIGQRGGDNESSCLDANHQVNVPIGKPLGNLIDGRMEGLAIRQQRRDVFEENSLLGEVGDVPDFLL